ncbi:Type IV secretion system protein OS=Streptomyces griseomycini OX=66895 GN=FHS37_007129 PE=4 SV=1 [Streptomyces griseomycini]
MRTECRRHLPARLAVLLAAVLVCFGGTLSTAPMAAAVDKPEYHADHGPGDNGGGCPEEFGDTCGIDKDGNYCDYYNIDDEDICRLPEAGEMPGTGEICSDPSVCSDEERKTVEEEKLEKWRQTNLELVKKGELEQADFDKWFKYLDTCVDKGTPLEACKEQAYAEFGPLGGETLADWVGKKISEIARDALEEAAQYIGNAVVWLLEQFADIFNDASSIDLDNTGISEPMGIATALSAALAVFLLLLQFGKVSVSHRGEHAATAIFGLAKWALITAAYWTVTTTALQLSDAISTWIIDYSFDGGEGTSADEAMKAQFGKLFGGLIIGGGGTATATGALVTGQGVTAAAVAVVIVIGIVCILAIGALWIEMILRQAGIMILVATMPIVLVGQMSDATKDWWPKARDALLALILMKPMIVFCFSIGFFAISEGDGMQNVIVGLVIFLMACFCWPVLAKFMTFSTLGAGAAMAGGLISSLGSSAASAGGGYRPELGGAGAVGGGPAYTRALERDNAQIQAGGSNAQGGGGFWTNESLKARVKGPGGRLGTRVAGPLGLGLQVLAAGKDTLESGMANTAAHAGLDSASPGGRHVVIPPRGPDTASLPPAVQERAPQPRPDAAPVVTGPPNTDIPSPREG